VVKTIKKDFAFMKHMEKYGVLYVRGRVPKGSPEVLRVLHRREEVNG
jgi:hypothetical protein